MNVYRHDFFWTFQEMALCKCFKRERKIETEGGGEGKRRVFMLFTCVIYIYIPIDLCIFGLEVQVCPQVCIHMAVLTKETAKAKYPRGLSLRSC